MITANWPAPSNIKAFTTTREGGVSQSPFGSNNLGSHVGDCPSAVKHNRNILAKQLPNSPIWLNQTHSTDILHIDKLALKDNEIPLNADASFTCLKETVCCVMTADCLPVLITNRQGNKVAAVHAGWRGLADGIIENAVNKFNDKPEELLVWLGPAIGPHAFEVGDDVYDQFIALDSSFAAGFTSVGSKYLADLYKLATLKLHKIGISHVYGGDYCTYKDDSLFYSYRRDGQTGRMASVIWIE